ncbi:tubulin polyglutamylase TTLL1, partial [Kipferlia bialata]|eukprot:g12580.t1
MSAPQSRIRFRTDFEKHCLTNSFTKRGWTRTGGSDWHFYWASVGSVRQLFSGEKRRLTDTQIVNHFPGHYELTRKDMMHKNMKKYAKEFQKTHPDPVTNYVPHSFSLPSEYTLVEDAFRKNPKAVWIVKPTNRAH